MKQGGELKGGGTMPETLNLEIVTPEGAVNSERVARCGGQIYSHHVSLMKQMMPGENDCA